MSLTQKKTIYYIIYFDKIEFTKQLIYSKLHYTSMIKLSMLKIWEWLKNNKTKNCELKIDNKKNPLNSVYQIVEYSTFINKIFQFNDQTFNNSESITINKGNCNSLPKLITCPTLSTG